MVEAHAGPLVLAGVHTSAVGERAVRELPCGALHGAELAVDSHHPHAAVVDESGPKFMASPPADLGAEPFLGTGHEMESIDCLSPGVTRLVRQHELGGCEATCERNCRSEVVRPLGFEPRTCGLRVRFDESHECPQVSDVLFRLRFRLSSRSRRTRGQDLRVRLRAREHVPIRARSRGV